MHESPESPESMPESMLESQIDSASDQRNPRASARARVARSRRSGWSAGSLLFGLATAGLATAVVFWSGWPTASEGTASASGEESASPADPSTEDSAGSGAVTSGPVQIATGVCDAHRLKALKAADPSLAIEIPAEFDKQFPSASACGSAVAAWDAEAPGPKQPIPFSHKHHAGQFKIECLYCHTGTDKSSAAGVPAVEVCMGCHAQFPLEYDEIEGIRILKQHWEEKRPIEWVQIHRLPEYVQFRHNRHIKAGVACQTCHGPVEQLDKLYLVPDTKLGYLVPVAKLEMGWCISCHRQNHQQASQDCLKCHY